MIYFSISLFQESEKDQVLNICIMSFLNPPFFEAESLNAEEEVALQIMFSCGQPHFFFVVSMVDNIPMLNSWHI